MKTPQDDHRPPPASLTGDFVRRTREFVQSQPDISRATPPEPQPKSAPEPVIKPEPDAPTASMDATTDTGPRIETPDQPVPPAPEGEADAQEATSENPPGAVVNFGEAVALFAACFCIVCAGYAFIVLT
ncbi:MAG: hypothetical protein O7A03_00525 [Alphaproteobacteria bacterium]|nr:hypothetical protein [Alphaproteobacteria bacterium]